MFSETVTYHQQRRAKVRPILFAVVASSRVKRIFAKYTPSESEANLYGSLVWAGTYTAGSGIDFSGSPVIDCRDLLLSFGGLSDTLMPQNADLIASYNQAELPAAQIILDNTDGYFSTLLSDARAETFLLQTVDIYQGFAGCAFADLQKLFTGTISEVHLSETRLTLTCEPYIERGALNVPSAAIVPSLWLSGGISDVMAAQTFADTELSALFRDSWTLTVNFWKDTLDTTGVLFEIESTDYALSRLQIGIDGSNNFYVTVGYDSWGSWATDTYTDSYALDSGDIGSAQYAQISWNEATNTLTFSYKGIRSQVTTTKFEQTAYTTDTIRIGNGFDGKIRAINFSNVAYWVNTTGKSLSILPDTQGDLDLLVVDGTWGT